LEVNFVENRHEDKSGQIDYRLILIVTGLKQRHGQPTSQRLTEEKQIKWKDDFVLHFP
jgi:hypothetical protein